VAIFENTDGKPVAVSTGRSETHFTSDSASRDKSTVSFSDARNEMSETHHVSTLDKNGHVSTVDSVAVTRNGSKDVSSIAVDDMGNRTASLSRSFEGHDVAGVKTTTSFAASKQLAPDEAVPDLRGALVAGAMGGVLAHTEPVPHGIAYTEAHAREFSGKNGSTVAEQQTRSIDAAGHETRGLDTINRSVGAENGRTVAQTVTLHQDDHGNKSTAFTEELTSASGNEALKSQHTESVAFHDPKMDGKWAMPMEAHRIGEALRENMTQTQAVSETASLGTTVPTTSAPRAEGQPGAWSFGGGLGHAPDQAPNASALSSHTYDSIVGFLTEKAGYAAHEAKAMVSGVSEYVSQALHDRVPGAGGALEFHKSGAEAVTLNHNGAGSHASYDGNTASIPVDQLKAVHESGRVQDLASRDMASSASQGHELTR
jgi:hypothetical protein